jgi:hypothetical protein
MANALRHLIRIPPSLGIALKPPGSKCGALKIKMLVKVEGLYVEPSILLYMKGSIHHFGDTISINRKPQSTLSE